LRWRRSKDRRNRSSVLLVQIQEARKLSGFLLLAAVGAVRNDVSTVLDAALARYARASSYEVVYFKRSYRVGPAADPRV
jgi:hypothetical protein